MHSPTAHRRWVERRMTEIRRAAGSRRPVELVLAQRDPIPKGTNVGRTPAPEIAKAFEAFVKRKAITTRWDDRFFYVESNGMPDHPMMVGITAWQQQVPIPQKYVGDNAWQIPLHTPRRSTRISTAASMVRSSSVTARLILSRVPNRSVRLCLLCAMPRSPPSRRPSPAVIY